MKKKIYKLYGIDLQYELEIFKHVGDNYGNSKIVSQNSTRNVIKKYEYCNTYSAWEIHVKQSIFKDMMNKKDLLHWLYMLRRNSQRNLEIVKVIFIPVYITMFAAFSSIIGQYVSGVWEQLVIAGLSIIVASISLFWYFSEDTWVSFYDDFIKVIENEFDM